MPLKKGGHKRRDETPRNPDRGLLQRRRIDFGEMGQRAGQAAGSRVLGRGGHPAAQGAVVAGGGYLGRMAGQVGNAAYDQVDEWDNAFHDWVHGGGEGTSGGAGGEWGAEDEVDGGEGAGGGGAGGGGADGGGGNEPMTLFKTPSEGSKVFTVKFEKMFYHHFPNYHEASGKQITEQYTPAKTTVHFPAPKGNIEMKALKVDTCWFQLPWRHVCMYMGKSDIDKFAKGMARGFRIDDVSCELSDFTALNDSVTTVAGAITPVTMPTNQPYFHMCVDKHHTLPNMYPDEPINSRGNRSVESDRNLSKLKNVTFWVPNQGNDDSAFKICDVMLRQDTNVQTVHCNEEKLKFHHKMRQRGFTEMVDSGMTAPYSMSMSHDTAMFPAEQKLAGSGNNDTMFWEGKNGTEITHLTLGHESRNISRIEGGPIKDGSAGHAQDPYQQKTNEQLNYHGTSDVTLSNSSAEVTRNKFENCQVGSNTPGLQERIPRVLFKGPPYQDGANKVHPVTMSFWAKYSMHVSFKTVPGWWPWYTGESTVGQVPFYETEWVGNRFRKEHCHAAP